MTSIICELLLLQSVNAKCICAEMAIYLLELKKQ